MTPGLKTDKRTVYEESGWLIDGRPKEPSRALQRVISVKPKDTVSPHRRRWDLMVSDRDKAHSLDLKDHSLDIFCMSWSKFKSYVSCKFVQLHNVIYDIDIDTVLKSLLMSTPTNPVIAPCVDIELNEFPMRMRDWLKNVLVTLFERDEDNNLLTEKQKLRVRPPTSRWSSQIQLSFLVVKKDWLCCVQQRKYLIETNKM